MFELYSADTYGESGLSAKVRQTKLYGMEFRPHADTEKFYRGVVNPCQKFCR